MEWKVRFHTKTQKRLLALPEKVLVTLDTLVRELKHNGPVRGNWSNYSKLGKAIHHCHLTKGSPHYVAVWEVIDKKDRIIEVIYVGTHEKAPY